MIEVQQFKKKMDHDGWYVFDQFIEPWLVGRMLDDLGMAYKICRKYQEFNEIENSEGTCHHLIGQGGSFMDFLHEAEKLSPYLEDYFGGKYIVNSFGGNVLKAGMSYANNVHRDIRSFSGKLPLMLNMIVMLDDFTEENGATWLMRRGHIWSFKPSDIEFKELAFQVVGKSGSVAVFNSNMWHAAGENKTDKPRRSVTPIFSRPFFKPGFDYPRALGYGNAHRYSDHLQQVLGYHSRVPETLDQWYQPKSKRFYKSDQG